MSDLETALREAYAALPPPPPLDAGRTVVAGRRARRRRRAALAVPVAAVLAIVAVVTSLAVRAPAHRSAPTITATPPLPDLGRVGDYVATYLPDTLLLSGRPTHLVLGGRQCTGDSAFRGCWAPPDCPPSDNIVRPTSCDAELDLEITNQGTVRAQCSGATAAETITVAGRPGCAFGDLPDNDVFYFVSWTLPDGRTAGLRAVNLPPDEVIRFVDGIERRPIPGHPAPTYSPEPSYSPTPSRPLVDARPAGEPPAVQQLSLPEPGNAKAYTGDGWYLGITQGNSPGAASVEVQDGHGKPYSNAFVYSRVDGKPEALDLATQPVVATFGGQTVLCGAAAKGTTGVGVLDASGHRGWATLLDPGKDFDTLFWVYEVPGGKTPVATEDFTGSTETDEQHGPFKADWPG